ncbi:MAG TPA: 6-phosphogluconolactonase [Spirochaetales bacterium]|nr:6-phosphogluconolactonase [Spirochaetales bacterium]
MTQFRRFTSSDAWAAAAVKDFLSLARSFQGNTPMRICLAGGTSPIAVYRQLARAMASAVDEQGQVLEYILVPGDERIDVSNADQRNETMLRSVFQELLDDGQAQLLSWPDGPGSAYTMDAQLNELTAEDGTLFDLCYLGIGADGHTAGLFPGYHKPLSGRTVDTIAPSHPYKRVSLTLEAIRACKHTRFLVGSRRKEQALARFADRDPSCIASGAITRDTVVFVLS